MLESAIIRFGKRSRSYLLILRYIENEDVSGTGGICIHISSPWRLYRSQLWRHSSFVMIIDGSCAARSRGGDCNIGIFWVLSSHSSEYIDVCIIIRFTFLSRPSGYFTVAVFAVIPGLHTTSHETSILCVLASIGGDRDPLLTCHAVNDLFSKGCPCGGGKPCVIRSSNVESQMLKHSLLSRRLSNVIVIGPDGDCITTEFEIVRCK